MSQTEINRIKHILKENKIEATFLEHEPVIRSEEAAAMRGFPLKEGVKALLFTNRVDYVVADIPGDAKVDVTKLSLVVGWKKSEMRMATSEEVAERIKSIIVEQLGVSMEEVTPEASFIEDLGADSLDIVELIMALEEEYDMEIPDEDAEKIQSVQDVITYVQSKQG